MTIGKYNKLKKKLAEKYENNCNKYMAKKRFHSENNKKINKYKKTISIIIGKGVGVILTDNRKRVLLQHRDRNNKWNQDAWGEFGGQIEKNETPERAVKRELKEEIGIELANLEFFKKYELQKKGGIYEAFFYVASLNTPINTLKSQQKEGKDVRFFTFQETKNLKMADYTKKALKDFFGQ